MDVMKRMYIMELESQFEKFSLIWTALFCILAFPSSLTYMAYVRQICGTVEATRAYVLQNLPYEIGAVLAAFAIYGIVLLLGRLFIVWLRK